MSCFQGRQPFLKFCSPQINATVSARDLREGYVALKEQGSHFVVFSAHLPLHSTPDEGPPGFGSSCPPRQSLSLQELRPIWASFLRLPTVRASMCLSTEAITSSFIMSSCSVHVTWRLAQAKCKISVIHCYYHCRYSWGKWC